MERLDSRLRGNDINRHRDNFYESIKVKAKTIFLNVWPDLSHPHVINGFIINHDQEVIGGLLQFKGADDE